MAKAILASPPRADPSDDCRCLRSTETSRTTEAVCGLLKNEWWLFQATECQGNLLCGYNSPIQCSSKKLNFNKNVKQYGDLLTVKKYDRGAWVAQSVKHPTSAMVRISQFISSSPASGSVLTAQSLEPASDSVSPSLSAPPCLCSVPLCLLKNTIKC